MSPRREPEERRVDEEQRPKRRSDHELGQALDELSVHELEDRIALLQIEIERLRSAKSRKQQALDAAGSVFGKRTD